MGDALKKAQAGQKLEIPAEAYNAFLDAVRFINHRPCHNHAAIGCGISVDAAGYAICSIGGAIDSVLDLNVRTQQLKDLFDPKQASSWTDCLPAVSVRNRTRMCRLWRS